jgi:hypothetical protein
LNKYKNIAKNIQKCAVKKLFQKNKNFKVYKHTVKYIGLTIKTNLVKKLNLYPIVKYIIMITTDMC